MLCYLSAPIRATTMFHPTQTMHPPLGVQIDKKMVQLVKACWKWGLRTAYSCQGNGEQGADRAYISFESVLEAVVFLAFAGPMSWSFTEHCTRHAEHPPGTERWTWDWTLEHNVVRFPSRDIPRATRALRACRWTLAGLIGASSVSAPSSKGAQVPRTCRGCGGVMPSGLRRDAIYCSRRCQLRARQRGTSASTTPSAGES
jgi:hypothetical protein